MKYIIAILIMIGSAFAQNTTYKDGIECNCDSIHTIINSNGNTDQVAYNDGTSDINSYVSYYPNGIIAIETRTTDGIKSRYMNGHIKEMLYHVNGIATQTWYYISGQVESVWTSKYIIKNGDIHYIGISKRIFYFQSGLVAGIETHEGFNSDNTHKNYVMKCSDGRFGNEYLNCLN